MSNSYIDEAIARMKAQKTLENQMRSTLLSAFSPPTLKWNVFCGGAGTGSMTLPANSGSVVLASAGDTRAPEIVNVDFDLRRIMQEMMERYPTFKLPKIENIEVKNNPDDDDYIQYLNGKYQKPTVIVTFADGTTEKAVTSEDDTFSLEQGISICYTKMLLSMLTADSGSKAYNKMLHNAIKLYKKQQEETANKEKEVQLAKEKADRLAAKRAKRKAKLEAKKREQEISVQAEAYARALRMVNQDKTENK